MKRFKFTGGILEGVGRGYCWVSLQVSVGANGTLISKLPDTVYCGKCCGTGTQQDSKDIIYHKRDVNGEVRYVWIDEME